MKITDVTLTLFAWDDIPPTQYIKSAGGFGGASNLGLLRVATDQGLEGHAFLGSASRPAEMDGLSLIRYLKPIVMGQNPLDRERLFQSIWSRNRMTTLRAIGAMDVALWDLCGKIAGLPLYQMMGAYREAVPAYASSAILPSAEAYIEEALKFRDAGWAAYKIHPPTPWSEDIKILRQLRTALGDYRLMLDGAWSYTYEQAVRVGRTLEELDFYWYEDPLVEDDLYNYTKLRQKLDIPIVATEFTMGGLHSYAPWLTLQATDFLRGDVAVKGGITTMLKTAHLAEAFHMNYEVHHGGNSLNNLANLHVICAIKNCELFEVLLPDNAQKYGLANDITVGSDGLVHVPKGPGLGAEIDFDLIARKTISTLA